MCCDLSATVEDVFWGENKETKKKRTLWCLHFIDQKHSSLFWLVYDLSSTEHDSEEQKWKWEVKTRMH